MDGLLTFDEVGTFCSLLRVFKFFSAVVLLSYFLSHWVRCVCLVTVCTVAVAVVVGEADLLVCLLLDARGCGINSCLLGEFVQWLHRVEKGPFFFCFDRIRHEFFVIEPFHNSYRLRQEV